jgi:hypothetical protein
MWVGSAPAALIDRGGGLIYDSDFNITWQQDANLAATNTFGVAGISGTGTMDWSTANSWIAAMNNADYLGYSDWRLPTALNQDASGPCSGFDCTGSEMGHLIYTEGGLSANQNLATSTILNSYFVNMQSGGQDHYYWSGTEYAQHGAAWAVDTWGGYQGDWNRNFSFSVWAVRPGDVTAAVPEPETYAMLLAGLGVLGFAARHRKQKEAAA